MAVRVRGYIGRLRLAQGDDADLLGEGSGHTARSAGGSGRAVHLMGANVRTAAPC